MKETLTINEIYHSIQGESTWAGLPCVFVRLTFCDLRCTYCDTAYAFYSGSKLALSEIIQQVLAFDVAQGEATRVEKLVAFYTSRDPAVSDTLVRAARSAARHDDFAASFERHTGTPTCGATTLISRCS